MEFTFKVKNDYKIYQSTRCQVKKADNLLSPFYLSGKVDPEWHWISFFKYSLPCIIIGLLHNYLTLTCSSWLFNCCSILWLAFNGYLEATYVFHTTLLVWLTNSLFLSDSLSYFSRKYIRRGDWGNLQKFYLIFSDTSVVTSFHRLSHAFLNLPVFFLLRTLQNKLDEIVQSRKCKSKIQTWIIIEIKKNNQIEYAVFFNVDWWRKRTNMY